MEMRAASSAKIHVVREQVFAQSDHVVRNYLFLISSPFGFANTLVRKAFLVNKCPKGTHSSDFKWEFVLNTTTRSSGERTAVQMRNESHPTSTFYSEPTSARDIYTGSCIAYVPSCHPDWEKCKSSLAST